MSRDRKAAYFPRLSDPPPDEPCPNCHGSQWWQRDTGEWVCQRCHPNPWPIGGPDQMVFAHDEPSFEFRNSWGDW